MAEKPIGQVLYEKARDELHKDYFADVRLHIDAFRGNSLTKQLHTELQIELNYCYAKFVVLRSQPMARIILQPFEYGKEFTMTIIWPPSPWEKLGTKEDIPTWLPR